MDTNNSGMIEGESEQKGKIKNWFQTNWRMVLATIVIICIGIGAYAYYENYYQPKESEIEEELVLEEEFEEGKLGEEEFEEEEVIEEEIIEGDVENEEIRENNEGEENAESISFEESEEFKGYIVTAQKGEGITHLARKALAEYLEDKGSDENLAKEHKIYIEDYLQNRTGTEWLQLGETRNFSENLIEEAINASGGLNNKQLENLEQFSELVPSLT